MDKREFLDPQDHLLPHLTPLQRAYGNHMIEEADGLGFGEGSMAMMENVCARGGGGGGSQLKMFAFARTDDEIEEERKAQRKARKEARKARKAEEREQRRARTGTGKGSGLVSKAQMENRSADIEYS